MRLMSLKLLCVVAILGGSLGASAQKTKWVYKKVGCKVVAGLKGTKRPASNYGGATAFDVLDHLRKVWKAELTKDPELVDKNARKVLNMLRSGEKQRMINSLASAAKNKKVEDNQQERALRVAEYSIKKITDYIKKLREDKVRRFFRRLNMSPKAVRSTEKELSKANFKKWKAKKRSLKELRSKLKKSFKIRSTEERLQELMDRDLEFRMIDLKRRQDENFNHQAISQINPLIEQMYKEGKVDKKALVGLADELLTAIKKSIAEVTPAVRVLKGVAKDKDSTPDQVREAMVEAIIAMKAWLFYHDHNTAQGAAKRKVVIDAIDKARQQYNKLSPKKEWKSSMILNPARILNPFGSPTLRQSLQSVSREV